MFARCQETFACFLHTPDPRGAFEVSDEEREAFYEKLYGERGFGIWQGNFRDILIDRKANATISDFVARKIRERVKNQAVAEKLIPKNHGFGTRRLPLETFYYEVYNQDNVELVDINGNADRADHACGHQDQRRRNTRSTSSSTRPASTPSPAAFDKIDFRGAGGARLKDKWKKRTGDLSRHHGPRISQHADADGPAHRARQYPAQHRIQRRLGHRTDPLCAWRTDLTRLEATPEGVQSWTDHVKALGVGLLSNEVNSWMTGINSNVEGKQTRIVARYSGSAPAYRARCDEVAAKGYEELRLG